MEALKKRHDLIVNVSTAVAFLVSYALCVLLGYIEIIDGLFTSTGENVGEVFDTPTAYILVCLLFYIVMYVLAILGIKLKSKVMALLPLAYQIVWILAFVMLALIGTGSLENESLINIVQWILVFALAPSFGVMWQLPFLLVIVMNIGLLILSIVATVKVFKKNKDK